MGSILKITTTLNVESDVLGKEAGALVKEAFSAIMPAVTKAVADYVSPAPEKPAEKKE